MSDVDRHSAAVRATRHGTVWWGLGVVLLALAVRLPRLNHSLWLDEMTTLTSYVLQPWSNVLAAGPGHYVPNNHVLHTVLAKLIYAALAGGRDALAAGQPPAEAVLRLPALTAGALLPIALAWPLRRRAPLAALAVAVVAAVHPWLVDLGTDARGYTLLLLLGVVATHLLPTSRPSRRRVLAYALAVAAAVYTVPLALVLIPAHAVAVAVARPQVWRRWLAGAGLAVVLAVALYLPMAAGLAAYYRHPYPVTVDYRTFLDALPRHALAGERLPRQHLDLARPPGHDHPPDAPGSAVFWALPVLVLIVGTALAWPRFPDARPLLATLATATALGALLPLLIPAATEVRFVTWAAPWFCLASALLLASTARIRPRWLGRPLAAASLVVLLGLLLWWAAHLLPNQPVREAVALADHLAPRDCPIAVAYIGALETTALYAGAAPGHAVWPAPDGLTLDSDAPAPWVVILFEQLARDRAATDPAAADIWRALTIRYRLVARLDGRVSPVAIYAPLTAPPARRYAPAALAR